MDKDTLIKRCYCITLICCIIISFIVLYPWKLSSNNIIDNYNSLKEITQSSIDFENKFIKKVDLPSDITLTIDFNVDQTINISAYYSLTKKLAPRINYYIQLSKDYDIIKTSPEEISISNYTIKKILGILALSLFAGIVSSLLIMFFICIILDVICIIKKRIN